MKTIIKIGGIGADYIHDCRLNNLKELNKIIIKCYDKSDKTHYTVSFTYLELCKFMKENDLGIKIFNTERDAEIEYIKMDKFYKKFIVSFVEDYTCMVVQNDLILTKIESFPGILYKNAKHDLINVTDLRTNAYDNFKDIYDTCVNFMLIIHKNQIYYGDLKCANIFSMKDDNIVIGDYGSLRYYKKEDPDENIYTYTYLTPSSDNFITRYTTGRESKYSIIKSLPDLFSEKNLRIIKKNWDIYDDTYDAYKYRKFFANADDWYHFGIAMIELIIRLRDKKLSKFINIIFEYFCVAPMLDNKKYHFKFLECMKV